MRRERSEEIRSFIVANVADNPRGIAGAAVAHFGITRAAVGRHLHALVTEGILEAEGKTRSRTYKLRSLFHHTLSFAITPALQEDKVWRDSFAPATASLPKNIRDICQHGFTEIFNNAIDHSESDTVKASMTVTAASVEMLISDHGVGIFRKIMNARSLDDERHAILEISKCGLTTVPSRHSGIGIFFTSRMFDKFLIASDHLSFVHMGPKDDWLIENRDVPAEGTFVAMCISTASSRTTREVFDEYAPEMDEGFARTHVLMDIVRYGEENLVSRSQAKRLLAGIDRFREVVLDFKGVLMIGQAFADEIFRVFHQQNPQVRIVQANTNDEVAGMIRRVMAAEGEST